MKKAAARMLDRVEQYRPVFLARSRREKILFAVFVVVIALVWAGTLPGRVRDRMRDVRLARQNIAEQDRWFNEQGRIEEDYQRALASLDPDKLPPRQQVVAQLEAQARQTGMSAKIDPSTSTRADPLTFHTINVSFNGAPFAKVAEFQRAVAAALPSVNLKSAVITAPRAAPGGSDINARLTFEAIEYTH